VACLHFLLRYIRLLSIQEIFVSGFAAKNVSLTCISYGNAGFAPQSRTAYAKVSPKILNYERSLLFTIESEDEKDGCNCGYD